MDKIHNDLVNYKRPKSADDIFTNGGANDDVLDSKTGKELTQKVVSSMGGGATGGGTEWAVGIARIGKGGSATWKHINDKGYELSLSTPYFNSHPVFGGIQQVTIDGQLMVKIPKFYYKLGDSPINAPVAGCKTRWISPTKIDDTWDCHPAFLDTDGKEIPYFYVGAYKATVDGTKMGSVDTQSLMVSKTQAEFINLALARNVNGVTGFKVISIYELSAIAWLCHIEMKGSDSQALIAPGHVNGTGTVAPNHPLELAASYRGIYGLWGNAYQYVQGFECNTSNGYLKVWNRNGNRQFVQTNELYNGMAGGAYSGWILDFLEKNDRTAGWDYRDLFIIGEVASSEATSTYHDEGGRPIINFECTHVGGRYSRITTSGIFMYANSSAMISSVTSRLSLS